MESISPKPPEKELKYWCQEETRIGLKTIERKKITALGVKPIGKVQWNFKDYYLYGAVAPQTAESFWLEFSHLDGMCFQMFLDQLAETYPTHLNIVQWDNRKFHQSRRLKIPDNILLIFQPPYSPKLNLGENMVTHKTRTELGISENLDGLKVKVGAFRGELSTEKIASIA